MAVLDLISYKFHGDENGSSSSASLKDIGNYLGLRNAIDQEHRVTKYIRSNLATVDIIPVDYSLSLNSINKTYAEGGKYAIEYDFASAIDKYKSICTWYKLDGNYGGLRLWLTDDTQSSEDFKHQFDNNIIESGINSLSGMGRSLRQIVQSTGTSQNTLNQISSKLQEVAVAGTTKVATGLMDTIGGMTGMDKEMSGALGSAISSLGKTAASIVFEGKQLSLPRIWKQSMYSPSVTFNIKLVSPYGSKEAVKYFIINPLLYILILASPRTKDGLSYGLFQPVRIKGYGISNINLGAIENVSIRRGGKDTSYNVWKQPLTVDVALSVRPLTDGFAVMEKGCNDVANFEAASWDYGETSSGSPAITTLGNVIQSFRPAPKDVVDSNNIEGAGTTNYSKPKFTPGSLNIGDYIDPTATLGNIEKSIKESANKLLGSMGF